MLTFVSAISLVGCAAGGAQFNSRTLDSGREPIKRMVVLVNAKSSHFSGNLYKSFVAGTQTRLESCNLAVSVLEFDPLELDMKEKYTKLIERDNPDAILSFLRSGGNLTTGSGGVSGHFYFDAEASDPKTSKTLWKARIDYRALTKNLFTDDQQSGERFALQFVSRLAKDQLISGCPNEVITPKS